MTRALLDATVAALGAYPPFDHMEPEALRFLASHLELAYYPRHAVLAAPEAGVAARLHILKQGRVRGGAGARGAVDVVLGAGEMLPVGALIGRRAVVYTYRAEEDTFCWELPAERFHELLEGSARFRDFCSRHLAALVERSHRALRADAGEGVAGGMLRPLREAIARAPVSCPPHTPVREVLARMHQLRIGSMVVADAGGTPLGIFTQLDVLERVALPQADVAAPVSSVMSAGVISLEEEEPIIDAALAMVKHGIRHVVVTRDGRLAGVVSERDLFALQRSSLRRIVERVAASTTPVQLAAAAADVRSLASTLLAGGLAAEQLTQMTAALNDSITQRAIDLASVRHELRGPWCWLALGSEGRLEQTLATDQDNALILGEEGGAPQARQRFLAFAKEVNLTLDACGFPLCKGGIMASNPQWCLTLEEWRGVFGDWIRNPQPEALLNAAIFFDFRALSGAAALAGELRDAVLPLAAANPAFRRAMLENALRARPPLGLLRDFVLDGSSEFPGTLDLKAQGARPFADGARLLALAHGLPATGTAARLRGAAAAGVLPAAEAAALADAFHFIQALRLRHQYLDEGVVAGAENRIRPDGLNGVDRRILKEALRQASVLQERLKLDYAM